MYLDFYGFRAEPFHITPDPDFLYLSPSHKEALAAIIYGVQQRKGFITITGEVGLGKTTVVRTYLERYDRQSIKTVLVFNANVSFKGLLRVIYRELGLDPPDLDPYEMVHELHTLLIKEYQDGWNVVLIIDEAQNMPVETLENLRMLSNLESTKDKLLQIILIGQTELENLLNLKQLRQLKQRIAIRTSLRPLTPKESADYIRHRLSLVQTEPRELFTQKALDLIIQEAQGIPRKINILCDNAFITGFGYGRKTITPKIVREVIHDLEGRPHPKSRSIKRLITASLSVAALAGVVLWQPQLPRTAWTWVQEGAQRVQSWRGGVDGVSVNPSEKARGPDGSRTTPPTTGPSSLGPDAEGQRIVKPLPLANPVSSPSQENAPARDSSAMTPPRDTKPHTEPMKPTPGSPPDPRASVRSGERSGPVPRPSTGLAILEKDQPAGSWSRFEPTSGLLPSHAIDPEMVRLTQTRKSGSLPAPSAAGPVRETASTSPPTDGSAPSRPSSAVIPQPDPGRVIEWILNKRRR